MVLSVHIKDNRKETTVCSVGIASASLATIDYVNFINQEGRLFEVDYQHQDIDNNESRDILVRTSGRGTMIRLVSIVGNRTPWEMRLFEGATVSADGTTLTPTNRNRLSTFQEQVFFGFEPTVTDDGTEISFQAVPDATGNGGYESLQGNREGADWILLPNTDYLFRITNIAGSANVEFSVVLVFYETQDDLPAPGTRLGPIINGE